MGHKAAVCPQKTVSSGKEPEQAPFVCYLDTQDPDIDSGSEEALAAHPLTTSEAMTSGLAVLDGGATKTLGSVQAVEALMRCNQELKGHTGVGSVDLANRPVFAFGNSSTNKCLSTVDVQIAAGGKSGRMAVHTIEEGSGPILISVETLRALGAVIDFRADLMVCRALDPKKIIPVQRSATGHQLISLTEDLFKHAKPARTEVPGLGDYLADGTSC